MSADLDPSRHRVLLVGPRVVPLKGLFEKRGYPLVAAANGVEGMAQLDTDPCDLVVLELNLGDLTATEFLMAARQGSPRATFLLVDEPARAGQIVKALQAGLDGFLAAPADEDRLFYEVERHLRRVGADVSADDDASGFEDHSTQTQMTTVEATRAGIDLRDAQGQLEQAREALATLAAENERLTNEVRRFDAVQGALAGQLEGRLDVDEATRLRERLGLAQVAEIELLTLRGDVQSLKAARREQDQRIEELLRDLRQARAAAEDARGFAEPPPTEVGRLGELEGRVGELEGEVSRWERRSRELEATLAAAKQALSLAEEETETAVLEARAAARGDLDAALAEKAALEEQQGLLQAEIDRLTGIVARAEAASVAATSQASGERAEVERLRAALAAAEAAAATAAARAAEDEIRQSAATEEAITAAVATEREAFAQQKAQAVKEAVAAERARLEREQTSALEVAMSAASNAAEEKHRAALAQSLERERERSAERERIAVAAAVAEARAESGAVAEARANERIAAALDEARASRERADDVELQLEEARTRVEFLEMDAARVVREADERIAAAEAAFKKEKLRLVEEKQAAASGSQEAILRMDALREEALAARRQAEEASAALAAAEEAAAAAVAARDAADEQARQWREEREREAERAVVALDAVARVEAALGGLQAHARALEEREAAAIAAADDANARAAAAVEAAAAAAAEVDERVAAIVEVARAELESHAAALEARASALEASLAEAEARVAQAERRAAASDDARIAAEARGGAAQSALEARIATLEEQLRAAEVAAADARREAGDALDAERARAAAEQEAAVGAICDEVARLEEELLEVKARSAVDAGDAAARVTALEATLAERDRALAAATSAAASAVDAGETVRTLEGRIASLEQALSAAKSAEAAASSTLASERAAWEAERAGLQASSSAVDAAEAARQTRALEELRTQLAAAVEAKSAAEGAAVRVRTEAQAVHAQATRAVAELQQRLGVVEHERTAWQAEQARLQGLLAAAQGTDGRAAAEVAELRQRIVDLQGQVADPAMLATVRSLVDAVDPLRWGLGSAIDYLSPFEGNDAALAAHVRNLRLLSATLARLVGEASARPGTG